MTPARIDAHVGEREEIALGSLVDAELAFARMATERGERAAFLANFADDGVVFEPAPVRLRGHHDRAARRFRSAHRGITLTE